VTPITDPAYLRDLYGAYASEGWSTQAMIDLEADPAEAAACEAWARAHHLRWPPRPTADFASQIIGAVFGAQSRER
jgi:hypothetical protein